MDQSPGWTELSSPSASLSNPGCDTGSNEELLATQRGSDGGNNERLVSLKEMSLLDIQQAKYVKGIHTFTKEVESFEPEKDKLVQKRKAIDDELETLRKRQKVSEDKLMEATKALKAERAEAGISDKLWLQYEAFCASSFLQPTPGEGSLAIEREPNEEFNNCESAKSWAERFPSLYAEAIRAARKGSTAALEMLVALPDADDRGESGKMFEFAYEEPLDSGLAQMGGLWKFRASHDLSKPIKSEEKRASLIQRYNFPFEVKNKDQTESSSNAKHQLGYRK
ncbi:hypothetical protein E0Z10_g8291 [Xylaria hypoxylon]|uniref:Uncharacterized protein n=1 Tax=Xylaria hypoxylon TaxID=37992 RepID=A0A4Z0YM23_9PEZI|nr:hypothetical protein E0Z10_g8291 [Xylaria hypoxylon]